MVRSRIAFELEIGPLAEGDLAVTRFTGSEALSRPYAFEVEAQIRVAPPSLEDLVGRPAQLRIVRPGGAARLVVGEATRVELTGEGAHGACLVVRIEPRLATLARTGGCRIFQGLSVPDVVKQVLKAHGVKFRDALSTSYAPSELVVQYRESDLAFVSRLLEDEGIWYRFEHAPREHTLVLCDAQGGFAAATPAPYHADAAQAAMDEHVSRLEVARRIAFDGVELRDYDFEQPALDLEVVEREGEGALEEDRWPGGYLEPGMGRRRARTRLEELRYPALTRAGVGTCLGAVPGARLALSGHPDQPLNGEQLVIRVEHEGRQGRPGTGGGAIEVSYENRFDALPADRPYRPARRTPRPRLVGPQTATVVGPAGEEIHTDPHGRIRVQFHWDRLGQRDDRATPWIRLAQPWAGAGMGGLRVPRVGQEVVVRFLDGDPDRPFVVGAVYNGQHAPPIALPGEKTKSTNRSTSSPGSDGFNELRFEDAAGQEEVFVHGQKDANAVIEHDATRHVKANAAREVGNDRTKTVLGFQRLDVQQDDAGQVGGNQTLAVAASRTVAVSGDHREEVGGLQVITVGATRTVTTSLASADSVGLAAALTVGAAYGITVLGAENQAVLGLKSTEVAGACLEAVGVDRSEQVKGDRSSTTKQDFTGAVTGRAGLGIRKDSKEQVKKKMEVTVDRTAAWHAKVATLEADRLSIVVNGKVALTMEKSGKVTLTGANVTISEK